MARRGREGSGASGLRPRRIRRQRRPGAAARRLAAALQHDVPAVVRLLDGTTVEELRVEQEGLRLVVKRAVSSEMAEPSREAGGDQHEPGGPAAAADDAGLDGGSLAEAAANSSWTMTAPCVGVFRAASRPDAAPQAQLDATAEAGQVLGYVEAMGMMNEVEAGTSGLVSDILVSDGQPVEYGQPLLVISPTDLSPDTLT